MSGWSSKRTNLPCPLTGSRAPVAVALGLALAYGGATAASDETIYFSECRAGAAADCVEGDNSNAGTPSSPKKNLSHLNLNSLTPGTRLLFARGGSFEWPAPLIVEHPRTSAERPLVFEPYGNGPKPVFDVATSALLFGKWNNTINDGGYVFRDLKFQGRGVDKSYAFFFMHNLRDVIIENVEITGFYFGIQAQAKAPHGISGVTIRNSIIRRNHGMGILGQFSKTLIEGNTIEENNFSGSGFEHGTYLSGNEDIGGRDLVLRNNRYIRNSVTGGRCTGGNMTFHGRMDNVLIEGNTIEQSPGYKTPTDFPAGGCWLMSITQGWEANRGAEGMTNFVVRNNRLINGGNTAMAVNSAPGIVIEGNVIINMQPVSQLAIGLGHGFDYKPGDIRDGRYPNGDLADGGAIVRNNTVCQGRGASGSPVRDNAPNTTLSNNVVLTGAAATTGVCAR